MNKLNKKRYKELAGKLAIAYGAHSIGVSMQHFSKTYYNEENLSDFWYALAEDLDKELRQQLNIFIEKKMSKR
tara:strand:- start:292 stop:510 length:219 start_codon:yes stop_codon:yes gene_type:complete